MTAEKVLIEDIANSLAESQCLMVFTGGEISGYPFTNKIIDKFGIWEKHITIDNIDFDEWGKIQPNSAHNAIKRLQDIGLLKTIITKNIDNLHIKSGIQTDKIIELHGNYTKVYCNKCMKEFDRNNVCCDKCGSIVTSTIKNFGDSLDIEKRLRAREYAMKSDVCLVIGSSLSINPASSYPRIVSLRRKKLFIINNGETNLDKFANIKINADGNIILPKIISVLEEIL